MDNKSNESNEVTLRSPMAQASYSRLDYYKNCALAFNHKYVHKTATLAEPEHKDKAGNVKDPAWKRGSIIHQAMDDYINDRTQVLRPELYDLRFEIEEARALKLSDPSRVLTEQNKFFDTDYKPIDMQALSPDQLSVTSAGDPCPKDYHVLVIIDLLIFSEDGTSAKVIDLKSGRVHSVKHSSQTQLYALFVAVEYPKVTDLTTQLWYCDQNGKITSKDYTRKQVMIYMNFWNRLITKMHTDTSFLPNPHEQNCMFCNYGLREHSNKWVNKTGDCELSLDKRFRV